jgi:hypothetical protein
MQALVGQQAPFDHGRQQMKLLAVLIAAGEGAILAGPLWATARTLNGGEWIAA